MIKISKKVKDITLFLCLISFLCFLLSQKVFGQIESDNIVDGDVSCEEHIAAYDRIKTFAENQPPVAATVIIIARLGDGETSRKYNQQRLTVAKRSLVLPIGLPAEQIITAQGDRIRGKGQVEFYIRGRLFTIFKVGRRKNLKGRCL